MYLWNTRSFTTPDLARDREHRRIHAHVLWYLQNLRSHRVSTQVLIAKPNSILYLEVELIVFNVLYSIEWYKLSPLKTRDITHKTRRYRRDISMAYLSLT